MPKPTTKDQILEDANKEREALEALLATLTPEEITKPGRIGEWAIKDVLSHLIEWEGMVVKWYEAGVKGKTPAIPSEEYNWTQLPQLNHAIFLKYRNKSLVDVQKDFKASYKKIMKTIQTIPEKELFTRKHYAWTNNNLLAAYLVSATSSHYRWARTVIKKSKKK
ncbi:MAG: ClbS/DfsB family four-helix bundle protein [Anaerolineales bacterium]|nr:ClbS/DfsB family four-helix bundle protein [Anaerolineales bacterium]